MNILMIIIGSLLLVVPNLSFFDIVPDFIGYILIMLALKKSSFICYDIKDSYTMFRNLVWINAARIPFYAAFLLLSRETTLLLLFNFIFSGFEVFFLLRAFSKLFDGLAYLALREDNGDACETQDKSSAVFRGMTRMKALTIVFVLLRAICTVAPDLSLLSSTEYGTVTAAGIASISRYHAIFIIVGFVLSLALGITWFVYFRSYLNAIKADTEYVSDVDRKYNSFAESNPFAIVKDALFLCLTLSVAGTAFSIGLRFDGINLIPQFIGAAFFAAAVFSVRKYYIKQSRSALAFSIVYLVSSIVSWIYQYVFIRSFFLAFLNSDEVGLAETYNTVLELYLRKSFSVIYQFAGFIAVSLVEGALMILFILSFYKLLKAMIEEHTGNVILHSDESERSSADDSNKTTDSLLKLLKASGIIGTAAAAVTACESFLCVIFPPVWIPELVLKIVWVVVTVILISRIKSSIKSKYYL